MSFLLVQFFYLLGGCQKNVINHKEWPIFFPTTQLVLNYADYILASVLKMLLSGDIV